MSVYTCSNMDNDADAMMNEIFKWGRCNTRERSVSVVFYRPDFVFTQRDKKAVERLITKLL